jgi:hypothetical protein
MKKNTLTTIVLLIIATSGTFITGCGKPSHPTVNNGNDSTNNNNSNTNSNTNKQTHDTISVLSQVITSEGESVKFSYDQVNKRCTGWAENYSSYNYDSTVVVYNSNGTVEALVRNTSAGGYKTSILFLYDNAGKLKQLCYSPIDYYDDWDPAPNMLDTTASSQPFSYVNVNHDALNRISSLSSPDSITPFKSFVYASTNDSLLAEIISRTYNTTTNKYDSTVTGFESYNNIPNPYYRLFHSFCLMGGGMENSVTPIPLLPHYYYPDDSYQNSLTINPYLCTSINYVAINYAVSPNNLLATSWIGGDTFEYTNFYYTTVIE